MVTWVFEVDTRWWEPLILYLCDIVVTCTGLALVQAVYQYLFRRLRTCFVVLVFGCWSLESAPAPFRIC